MRDKRKPGLSADDKPVAMQNCAFGSISADFRPVSALTTGSVYCMHERAAGTSAGETNLRIQDI
jgi:hypothetical protein